HFFIKSLRGGIAAPDIQREIIEPLTAGILLHMTIYEFTDLLSSLTLIDTQIIDVQHPDIGKDRVIFVLNHFAERVAEHLVVLVRRDEDRALLITEDLLQLLLAVFAAACFEQIRASLLVHTRYLIQKLQNAH